ncbi:ATP-dependent DNA helicase [Trichonephila clavipes]|nr:ATP-dependent DNA helicase [Trichonephila clavipes]
MCCFLRATSLEGIYIVTENSDPKFFHGIRESTNLKDLQNKFKRLSQNKLKTITDIFIAFVSTKKEISIYSLNCQSLLAHALDLDHSVIHHVTKLLLTKTWLYKKEISDVPNFHCIAKFRRHNHRAGGVAIYENKGDTTTYVTPGMDVASNTTESFGFNESCIRQIWAAKCRQKMGK